MYETAIVPLTETDRDVVTLEHLRVMLEHEDVGNVILVRVVQPPPVAAVDFALDPAVVAGLEKDLRRRAAAYLESVSRLIDWRDAGHQVAVLLGEPAEELTRLVESRGADLIMLTPGPPSGVQRWFRGSLLDRLMRSAQVPITVLSGPARWRRSQVRAPRTAA
jgi:nucleotide-binding universal stress UspA family protein